MWILQVILERVNIEGRSFWKEMNALNECIEEATRLVTRQLAACRQSQLVVFPINRHLGIFISDARYLEMY